MKLVNKKYGQNVQRLYAKADGVYSHHSTSKGCSHTTVHRTEWQTSHYINNKSFIEPFEGANLQFLHSNGDME
jgi:hypothetical protein